MFILMFKVFYIDKSCTQKYSHVRMSETGHLIKSNILAVFKS